MKATIHPDIRAAAIAELIAGGRPADVARKYHLKVATVKSWNIRSAAPAYESAARMHPSELSAPDPDAEEGVDASTDADEPASTTPLASTDAAPTTTVIRRPAAAVVTPVPEAPRRTLGEMIHDLLEAKIRASSAIAQAAQNPAWLAKQTAAELAVLGQYLDESLLAIGDRLARASAEATDGDGADGDDGADHPTG